MESEVKTIEREIDSANQLLDTIDKSLPKKCKKIMLGGNHEARYAKFMANNGFILSVRRMKQFTSWQNEYNLMSRGWEAKEYGEHIQIGKIIFTHGWYTSNNACQQMARCFPGRNIIFGHTHRHDISGCMDEHDLPIESETIGTLSNFNLAYLKGKPPVNWVNGFMYVDMKDDGTFSKHFVHVIEGNFIEYGKEF